MMADPKASAFVENFAGQWLELRLLDDYEADPKRFPDFNKPLRIAMKQEAEQFFQTIVKEDRSVLELIDSNYTFLNERLAKFYGIPDVTGEHFRKVPLKAPSHRGGVLTMAGVLTVTAMPSRTSGRTTRTRPSGSVSMLPSVETSSTTTTSASSGSAASRLSTVRPRFFPSLWLTTTTLTPDAAPTGLSIKPPLESGNPVSPA